MYRCCTDPETGISIHAPANGATLWLCVPCGIEEFQSTLRRTERRASPSQSNDIRLFQSTLRRTERPIMKITNVEIAIFQSTLRRTERRMSSRMGSLCPHFNPRSGERSDKRYIRLIKLIGNFNPRSGERSDCGIPFISSYKKISIHAPANGATCPLGRFIRFAIFQSTLRRTERRFSQSLTIPLINFNPRSGERSDLQLIKEYREFNISIHAPANGATHNHDHSNQLKIFQSTLRRTERHYAGSA